MRIALVLIVNFLLLITYEIQAQKLDYKQGEIIVQLKEGESVKELNKYLKRKNVALNEIRPLSEYAGIYLISVDYTKSDEYRLVKELYSHKSIEHAQLNSLIEYRQLIPDDPLFSTQWMWLNTGQMNGTAGSDINITRAWEYTTGGTTFYGDTIVIAVLDSGVDFDHPDLIDNMWINHEEIPDDGIDNDNNGYIDDYYGWNFRDNSGEVNNNNDHGTFISGLIGGKGNNGTGITGVNWNIKVMNLARRGPLSEATVIEGYDYALQKRIAYNESNGEKGAFVVAINSSFGLDNRWAENYPIWCNFYDLLGENGILSCGATSNSPTNVDRFGDMPTTCGSDYLISVTAVDNRDRRNFSGYGLNYIDIAAPGENVHSTNSSGGYTYDNGTSYATPIVAGAIGLLYSYPCDKISALTKEHPARSAALFRDVIYEGVRKVSGLKDFLKYGGTLDVYSSMQILDKICSSCETIQNISNSYTHNSVTINWEYLFREGSSNTSLVYRATGASNWDTVSVSQPPFELTDLRSNTDYEFFFLIDCENNSTDSTATYHFRTNNFCEDEINITDISPVSEDLYILSWNSNGAPTYTFQFKARHETVWQSFFVTDTFYAARTYLPCSEFEFRVGVFCAELDNIVFGDIATLITAGCQGCSGRNYCPVILNENNGEFFRQITLNDWIFEAEDATVPYNYTAISTTELYTGRSYDLQLIPGYEGAQYYVKMKVWVDFNQNGFLEDNYELILSTDTASVDTIRTSFLVPHNAIPGITRIRYLMYFSEEDVTSCGETDYGYARDFCIEIKGECTAINNVEVTDTTSTSVTVTWDKNEEATLAYTYRFRQIGSSIWSEEKLTSGNTVHLSGLDPCTEYELQVKNICRFDSTEFNTDIIVSTSCPSSSKGIEWITDIITYPNPFISYFDFRVSTVYSGDALIEIYNIDGKQLLQRKVNILSNQQNIFRFDNNLQQTGVYILIFKQGSHSVSKKIIKI